MAVCNTCRCSAAVVIEFENDLYCEECWEKMKEDPEFAEDIEEEDEVVDQPRHYNSHGSGVECIEISETMDFCLGNAFKYLFRKDHKGSKDINLRKARWYVASRLAGPIVELDKWPPFDENATPLPHREIHTKLLAVIAEEQTPYKELMLLVWAANNPRQALELAKLVLDGITRA